MNRRKRLVDVGWLQVPEDVRRVRAPAMAGLLSAATRKKVSKGDALALVLDLWAWVLGQVDETAPDIAAEFDRCTFLPKDRAAGVLVLATEWPAKTAPLLLQALADPMVRLLVPEGDGWRVPHISDRYISLCADRADSRERTETVGLAKAAGWRSEGKNKWVHQETGEVVEHWRTLRKRLKPEVKP